VFLGGILVTLAIIVVASVASQHHYKLEEGDNVGVVQLRLSVNCAALAKLCEDADGIKAVGFYQSPLAVCFAGLSSIGIRHKVGCIAVVAAFVPNAEFRHIPRLWRSGSPRATHLKQCDRGRVRGARVYSSKSLERIDTREILEGVWTVLLQQIQHSIYVVVDSVLSLIREFTSTGAMGFPTQDAHLRPHKFGGGTQETIEVLLL
jgi:hypothetical protein